MGLSNSTSATYIGTYGGFFTVKCDADHPDAVHRTNRNNEDVYELRYNEFTGYITGVNFSEREHNNITYKNLNVLLRDGEDSYVLSVSQKSTFAQVFFQTMQDIDFGRKVTFKIWKDRSEDKVVAIVQQGGVTLKWRYTKGHPGDKPAWEKHTINGETVWDRTKEMAFYRNILETEILPKIDDSDPAAIKAVTALSTETKEVAADDDLPF